MKRLLPLLLAAGVMALPAVDAAAPADDLLFTEDWGDPASWNINNPPTGWTINDLVPGGNLGWVHDTFQDGHSAHVDYSPTETSFQYELLMDSHSVDCSGYSEIELAMDFVLDWYTTAGGVFEIWVSTDDWAGYDVALTHSYADGSVGYYDCWGGAHSYEAVVYGLTDYAAGYDNVKLGFVLSGTDTYDNLDGLLIDNLEIRGEAGSRTEVASFGEIKVAYH